MSLPEIEDPCRFQRLLRETLARLDAAAAEPREVAAILYAVDCGEVLPGSEGYAVTDAVRGAVRG